MERLISQIYEIQDPTEAERLKGMDIDHMGSVLLSEEEWKDKRIKDVGLFLKGTKIRHIILPLFRSLKIISMAVEYYSPQIIHLCDDLFSLKDRIKGSCLDLQYEIKRRFPHLLIMRSIPVPKKTDKSRAKEILHWIALFQDLTDIFLIDTYKNNPPVKGYVGITGDTCDWVMAKEIIRVSKIPVILAGGLGPENVYDALIFTQAAGADSCTETNLKDIHGDPIRFRKDIKKVKSFISEIRRAEKYLKGRR